MLKNEINLAEDKLRTLNQELNRQSYSDVVAKVIDGADFFATESELAEQLAFELTERDEPMSYQDIKQVFEFSGLKYNENHIAMARPDSQEVIDEQIRYYQE